MDLATKLGKLRFSEKATQNCFTILSKLCTSKLRGRFFQILWPSQNMWIVCKYRCIVSDITGRVWSLCMSIIIACFSAPQWIHTWGQRPSNLAQSFLVSSMSGRFQNSEWKKKMFWNCGFYWDFRICLAISESFWLHCAADKDDNDTHTLLTLYSLAQHAKMQIRAVQ